MHKKYKIIIASACLLALIMIGGLIVAANSGLNSNNITFVVNGLGDDVDKTGKTVARSIYKNYPTKINKMIVAQNSVTRGLIRFAIFSDQQIDNETQQAILSDIESSGMVSFLEVFFVQGETTYRAFVLRLTGLSEGTQGYVTYDGWYEVPNIAQILPWSSLELMLSSTGLAYPMYQPVFDFQKGIPFSYEDATPYIPKAGDWDGGGYVSP